MRLMCCIFCVYIYGHLCGCAWRMKLVVCSWTNYWIVILLLDDELNVWKRRKLKLDFFSVSSFVNIFTEGSYGSFLFIYHHVFNVTLTREKMFVWQIIMNNSHESIKHMQKYFKMSNASTNFMNITTFLYFIMPIWMK